jgi:hypothetical protein
MGKHHHHHHSSSMTADSVAVQLTDQSAAQTGSEQVLVERSTHVTVAQFETQSLVMAQTALEASLQALIAFSTTHNLNIDITELQAIIQRVKQSEKEKVRIVKSSDVTVTQTESQFAVLAQTAIDLLAQIVARL